jgi:hypothetical protein
MKAPEFAPGLFAAAARTMRRLLIADPVTPSGCIGTIS